MHAPFTDRESAPSTTPSLNLAATKTVPVVTSSSLSRVFVGTKGR